MGVMNMLGTPKFSNSLNLENMQMEFVIYLICFLYF